MYAWVVIDLVTVLLIIIFGCGIFGILWARQHCLSDEYEWDDHCDGECTYSEDFCDCLSDKE